MTPNLKLKMAMFQTGRKQYWIAHNARIEPTRLSKIITGRTDPTRDEMIRIAKLLGRPVEKLFP